MVARIAKTWLLPLMCLTLLTAYAGDKETHKDIFTDIESAISVGNAGMLSEFLNSSVELELPGEQEGIYSKQQAVVILNRFFNKFPPSSFKIVHRGNSAAGSKFAVGDYTTGPDKTFRVTIFIKKHGDNYLIQEVEFE
jgi:Domain of unknown function (DUF4783)